MSSGQVDSPETQRERDGADGTVEIVGDLPKYSPTKNRSYAYHDSTDCRRLDNSEVHERSLRYIDWHDLTPCPWCHDELVADDNKEECGNLAKRFRYGDLREEVVNDD